LVLSTQANEQFRKYLKWLFAAALVVFMIVWAYNQGSREGAEHRSEAAASQ
jgi:hypothetical protein